LDTYLTARTYPGTERAAEAQWLHAARNGERWALEQFYQRHYSQIYALCYRILGRSEDAEDAMQAAFVHAFRELPGFRGDSMARTWLYRIATNEAINSLRKRRRSVNETEADLAVSTPDAAPAVQRRLAVHSALSRLRPDHNVILVLRYWEDLSYEEICSVLNLSMPTVKMRLSRARAEFRRHYGEEP
jgi:RNA polymerase sigma-70 factor (ECF subfamily)